jgi:predicted RNase H-like HicB family nuclease
MQKLTAMIHRGLPEEGGYWATCLEVPGANGQGETREACLDDLRSAVRLLIELNREEALTEDPDAVEEELSLA